MAEGKSGMGGWKIAPNIGGAMLGFLIFGAGGCHGGDCSCPATPASAAIELGCVPTEPPVVKTTGPCSVCPAVPPNTPIHGCAVPENSSYIIVIASGAGTCHVDLTFANGAASSVDVDFVSQQIANCCGGERLSSPSPQMAATTIRPSKIAPATPGKTRRLRTSAPALRTADLRTPDDFWGASSVALLQRTT